MKFRICRDDDSPAHNKPSPVALSPCLLLTYWTVKEKLPGIECKVITLLKLKVFLKEKS